MQIFAIRFDNWVRLVLSRDHWPELAGMRHVSCRTRLGLTWITPTIGAGTMEESLTARFLASEGASYAPPSHS
jgi:hypothetical protein